ncbi:hypothetical protein ABEY37_26175 [Bacillus pacificus]|uniref:hypothetical protein n=1 Tax=Bacillus pacificus TaxID=2026187 RepID=UPI003D197C4A
MGKKRRYLKKRNIERKDIHIVEKEMSGVGSATFIQKLIRPTLGIGSVAPMQKTMQATIGSSLVAPMQKTMQATIGSSLVAPMQKTMQATIGSSLVAPMQKTMQATIGSSLVAPMQKTMQATIGSSLVAPMQRSMQATIGSSLVASMQKTMQATIGSSLVASMQKSIQEQYKPILQQIRSALDVYNSAGWDLIEKSVVEKLKHTDSILVTYEKEYWCLDMDIMTFIMNGSVTEENLSKYVEDNLQAYVDEITQNPMYEVHSTLITEAYEAYKIGLYKLCIMPLFAAFEHIMAFWYKGNITEETISIKSNPNVWRLHQKIKPEKYLEFEVEKIKKVFVASVLRTFKITFAKGSEELGKGLNRNSIAHGFHDYDSITNLDVLKLFQLLKSALILQFASSKNLAES